MERNKVEETLRLFRSAVEQSGESIMITDAELDLPGPRIIFVNPAFTRMTGYGSQEVIGKTPRILQGPRTDRHVLQRLRHCLDSGDEFDGEAINYRKDGSEYYQEWQIAPIRDGNGSVTHFIATQRDITQRKDAEARIRYLNRVYAMLSGINALIVRVRDNDELYAETCRIAVEGGGFRMAMICAVNGDGRQIVPVASAGKNDELIAAINDILSSREKASATMVARAIREKQTLVANDSQRIRGCCSPDKYAAAGVHSVAVLPLIVSEAAVGVIALYAEEVEFFQGEEMKLLSELTGDIAFAIDHIDKRDRLHYLAYYDDLTGLANRDLFLERVGQFMRGADAGGHKLALLMFDLERFKNINDSFGRAAGDTLLKHLAAWLTAQLGEANLLARGDADRFALLMPQVRQSSEVARLVEKMLAALLENPFHLNDDEFRVGAKIGIALFPDDGSDAEALFKNAEAALKATKKSGDRYLFHTRKMTEAVAVRVSLENQLRQAVDNEEFVLYYQPKISIRSGRTAGAEALIRWDNPRAGLVPPGEFIPIMEETGLIYDVGRWALRQAIADYLRWRAAGLHAVRISVNVSPLQLRNPDFVTEIKRKIGVHPDAARGLELELTESSVMQNIEHSITRLRAIRDMGVRVAIDDFGTGFSSLSYLARLPLDTLKIDRIFVLDITSGPNGLALVSTIINLAHSLGLKVVAEGVETEEQSRLLRLLSCNEMQGFLFSEAVPVDIFEARFLNPVNRVM